METKLQFRSFAAISATTSMLTLATLAADSWGDGVVLLAEELFLSADLEQEVVHVHVIQVVLGIAQGLIDQQVHSGGAWTHMHMTHLFADPIQTNVTPLPDFQWPHPLTITCEG